MLKDTTDRGNLQQDAENNLNWDSIERCPHDSENPYVMINRDILRNPKLSFQARGFLAYLLSFDKSWKFIKKHIMKSQYVNKDRLTSIINELCEAGHMKIEVYFVNGLKRTRYLVSEFCKFKIIFAKSENPAPVEPPPGKSASKKEQEEKKEQIEETPISPKRGQRSLLYERRKAWAYAHQSVGQCGYSEAFDDRYVVISGNVEQTYLYKGRDPFWENLNL